MSQQESKQGLFNERAASSAHGVALSSSCIDKCRLKCIGLGTIDIAIAKTSCGWEIFLVQREMTLLNTYSEATLIELQ